ncbi:IS3 family transposase [Sedimentibacter sp. zth1]|uniref:IS3 family transposase n=1 Tax=Sedimentibacter sp. zth1 TaxID=2816908 RepID=UPI001A926845|nr:IS3 family transposase [Sedimentibacter sp. zth1]QSX06689.1 IS3 family transposase [Sedimentibacter sp. zth1]
MNNRSKLNVFHITELKKNKYVISADENKIHYSNDLKKKAILLSMEGYTAKQTFTECGFDISYLGTRPTEQIKIWKKQYKMNGFSTFEKTKSNYKARTNISKDMQIAHLKKELKQVKDELAYIKKLEKIESEVKLERYIKSQKFKLIKLISEKKHISISTLCSLANVSRSGYYNYFCNKSTLNRKKRSLAYIKDVNLIKKVFAYKGFKKGSRCVKALLLNMYNTVMSLNKIQKIMRENGMKSQIRKANAHRKMNLKRQESHVIQNILKRRFKTGIPRNVLLTDITYLFYNNHKKRAYLSVIKDAETNEIISYDISENLDLNIVLNTINNLELDSVFNTSKNNIIIHSDQGSQYTTSKYQNKIKELGLIQSMSRRANCWDNAPIESFFGTLKQEISINSLQSFTELKNYINVYINYYNNERPQLSLNNITPIKKLHDLLSMGSKNCSLQWC